MPKRCYRCGLVECETCGGTNFKPRGPYTGDEPCPDCEGGWQEAKMCTLEPCPLRDEGNIIPFKLVVCDHGEEGVCRCTRGIRLGSDLAILCPACEADKLEAAVKKHVRELIAGDGVRPLDFRPGTGRSQCDVPNEGNVPKEIKVLEVCRKCGSIRCAGCGTWTWRKEYKDEAAALANEPILGTDPEALCDRCAPGTPVRYIGQGYIDRSEGSSAAGLSTEGWYFWDETWAFAHGPFATEAAADAGISKYAARLEANRG